jgi:hypothetical protein
MANPAAPINLQRFDIEAQQGPTAASLRTERRGLDGSRCGSLLFATTVAVLSQSFNIAQAGIRLSRNSGPVDLAFAGANVGVIPAGALISAVVCGATGNLPVLSGLAFGTVAAHFGTQIGLAIATAVLANRGPEMPYDKILFGVAVTYLTVGFGIEALLGMLAVDTFKRNLSPV